MNWRRIGPANMGGRDHRPRRRRGRPDHLLRRHRVRRAAQDDQQRHHLRAPVRQAKRPSPSATWPSPRRDPNIVWVGTGEANPRNSRLLRRRRLQVHRRRQDVEEHGPEEVVPDRQDRHPPEGPEHRLRRRARPAVRPERGARRVQDRPTAARPGTRSSTSTTRPACIDMRMDPTDPDTLIVAHVGAEARRVRRLLRRRRRRPTPDEYGPIVTYGPGGGLYKTTDGGKTWKKLRRGKRPADREDRPHRAGLLAARPKGLVYAIIDTEKVGTGAPPLTRVPGHHRRGRRGRRREADRRSPTDGPAGEGRAEGRRRHHDASTARRSTTTTTCSTSSATKKAGDKVKLTVQARQGQGGRR